MASKKTKKASFAQDHISVLGAKEHNLKNVDVQIPINKLTVITGLSGSGKSSLAFDTLYAEGQRRYVESLSSYARQFLGVMNKPDVESIKGLSPAISIEQKSVSKNPRSTVGTITEIYDYLRLLYARIGVAHCPICFDPLISQSLEDIATDILKLKNKTKIALLSPVIRERKGRHEKLLDELHKQGYIRVLVDGEYHLLEDRKSLSLNKNKKHSIAVVIDRLVIEKSIRSRLIDSLEQTAELSDGLILVKTDKQEKLYSQKATCTKHDIHMEELQPRMFSFNSPAGACEHCHGLGIIQDIDEDLVIPDPELSLGEGAVKPWQNVFDSWRGKYLESLAEHYKFDLWTPFEDLPKKVRDAILYGTQETIQFSLQSTNGNSSYEFEDTFEGVIPQLKRLYQETDSEKRREAIAKFMRERTCEHCQGKRLKPEMLAVLIEGKSIADVTDLPIEQSFEFFKSIKVTGAQKEIAEPILNEILARLRFMINVGLEYLTLSRSAGTLSGGEAQRIRLATQIGSELRGVLYILDEPSIGLHQRDNQRLISTLQTLRDYQNTVIVVEHDEETIMAADYVLDLGPGAGIHGGEVVAAGTPKQIMRKKDSLTGQFLSGKRTIAVPKKRRKAFDYLEITGAKFHNLKEIDVTIPMGVFCCVTGVSGSGKSSLVEGVVYDGLLSLLGHSSKKVKTFKKMKGFGMVDRISIIDQSPIGRTPRSNPATYIGVFTPIRELFSQVPESKMRGYKPGRFSFNVKGGRCETCQGDGLIKIEMHFLPDVYVECEKCKGKRFNSETLMIKYKNKTIADVLDMSIEEALTFFANIPRIKDKLQVLCDVGLSYMKLGQSATTLSGGEAQRVKLVEELSKRSAGHRMYILDEPTTGLHMADIEKLLEVLNRLVDQGNTVLVIEHNLDVIKTADWLVDLGPEGGEKGGRVIAQGTPERIAKESKWSYTGKFLKPILEKK